jgi:hypothetical protein
MVGTDKPSNLKSFSESKLVFAFSYVDVALDVKLRQVKYFSLINLKVSQKWLARTSPVTLKALVSQSWSLPSRLWMKLWM